MGELALRQDWNKILERQKKYVRSGQGSSIAERKRRLKLLKAMIKDREAEWMAALALDSGKPAVEAYASEIAVVLNEIDFLVRHIRRLTSPRAILSTNLFSQLSGMRASVTREAYGSVLVISPWNYPLQLSLVPLSGALAAGNSCFLKPSELAPASAELLNRCLRETFPPEIVAVVEGDALVAEKLLTLPWDAIFFTGSQRVGALVSKAAAGRNIPATLELGGKNPCIVDSTGLNEATARRIVWGKFLNAGQTCIAPDTVWVEASCLEPLLDLLGGQIEEAFGTDPAASPDYGRIGHPRQMERLIEFLQQGQVRHGGSVDVSRNYVAPTLLTGLPAGSPIMYEEIFGPILPVLPYASLDALIEYLRSQPEPLAVYHFSRDKSNIRALRNSLRCGAFSVNQVIRYAASSKLPFGGVGASGYGRYHGKHSIYNFSYEKVHYRESLWPDWRFLYPPYGKQSLSALKWVRRWFI
ncbi:MAG: aldehyde dehydrogenase family protein [Syntrophomonadaceae bacterium]|nr:aldehyde dehydrogenase family protein [Syntrophomonadaceae bacterium]